MKCKKILIFLSVQLICSLSITAQKLDSLLKALDNYKKEDTVTINLMIAIAYEYQDINPDKGVEFADNAAVLSNKLYNNDRLANACLVKGENSYLKRDYKTALACIGKALDLYKQAGNKTGIAYSLNDMGRVYCYIADYTRAFAYFQEALELNSLLSNSEQTAKIFANIGFYYGQLFDCEKSIEYFQKSLKLYKELKIGKEHARMMTAIGRCYYKTADFSKALEYFQKALKISEELKDKPGIASNNYWLGVLYIDRYAPKSIDYYKTSLTLYEELDAKYYMADALNGIGVAYTAIADSGRITANHQKSIEYYTKSLNINEQLNNQTGIARNLGNLAFDYICSSDFIKAMNCLQRALAINQENDEKFSVADNLETIALIYYTAPEDVLIRLGINPADKYDKAVEKMKTALALFIKIGNPIRQTWTLLRIHDVYLKAVRFDSAYQYYKQYIDLKDSTYNVEKQKGMLAIELKHEFGKKEDSLKFNQQLTDEKLKRQILFAKQQQQQLDLNNKEKDLQKLAYLKTQADLQNEQLQKREKEKQLTLAEKEKQLQSVQVTTLSQANDLNKLKRRQQWLYSIAAFVLLGLVVSYLFYNNRIKQGKLRMELAKEKAEQEKKEAEFQRSLADVSLTALRSQMNPHFIFNCLNSIKLYTTQNETIAAAEYLTKFSRLIRLVMENSRNDRISLTAELDALRLYIEMEAMRFKEKLSYSISVDKNVEMDYVEIPPLLLQPYVENAIWHGLMHREEGGRIEITAAMKKNEPILEINIKDNGVGRTRAEELRSKTATTHKSYGMKVTSERIALINQIYKTGANVAIEDVTNDRGVVAGTQVIIQIPV